jgi:hypothetical protein
MLTQDGLVHLFDRHGTPAWAFQQAPELANVDADPTDHDVTSIGHDEVNLIAGIDAQQITNGLGDRDLPFARHRRSGHAPYLLSES